MVTPPPPSFFSFASKKFRLACLHRTLPLADPIPCFRTRTPPFSPTSLRDLCRSSIGSPRSKPSPRPSTPLLPPYTTYVGHSYAFLPLLSTLCCSALSFPVEGVFLLLLCCAYFAPCPFHVSLPIARKRHLAFALPHIPVCIGDLAASPSHSRRVFFRATPPNFFPVFGVDSNPVSLLTFLPKRRGSASVDLSFLIYFPAARPRRGESGTPVVAPFLLRTRRRRVSPPLSSRGTHSLLLFHFSERPCPISPSASRILFRAPALHFGERWPRGFQDSCRQILPMSFPRMSLPPPSPVSLASFLYVQLIRADRSSARSVFLYSFDVFLLRT